MAEITCTEKTIIKCLRCQKTGLVIDFGFLPLYGPPEASFEYGLGTLTKPGHYFCDICDCNQRGKALVYRPEEGSMIILNHPNKIAEKISSPEEIVLAPA